MSEERTVYLNKSKFHITATSVGFKDLSLGYHRIETDDVTETLVRFVNTVLRDFGKHYVKAEYQIGVYNAEQAEIDARLLFLRKMMATFSKDSVDLVLENLKHPDYGWLEKLSEYWSKEEKKIKAKTT